MNRIRIILLNFLLTLSIRFFTKPLPDSDGNTLLLVRLDGIGDYVLFRNFIKKIKKSERYKGYQITLLGNRAWKDIAEAFDEEHINNFIWLEHDKFNKSSIYRYKKVKEIASVRYETILSPVYGREFENIDTIINLVSAKHKIGSIGNLSNIKTRQKKRGDKYYTKLIPASNGTLFEFYRNKEFIENLLGEKLNIRKPNITLKPKKSCIKIPQKYAVLFIGGSKDLKQWGIHKFTKIAEYIFENYDLEIVLCGGPEDKKNAALFSKNFTKHYVDLVGRASLIDLLYVIHNGSFMVSNETLAPHFAMALGMPHVFVIYSGNHFGRFSPYPKKIGKNYHAIYHPEIGKNPENYKRLCERYQYESKLDIDEIKTDSLLKQIKKYINCDHGILIS